MARQYKPGPGWRWLAGSVWEHVDGTRLHLMGLVLVRGKPVYATSYPNSLRLNALERITGSTRRAMFVFANDLRKGR